MRAPGPSSLDSNALALRLAELAGEERDVQVDATVDNTRLRCRAHNLFHAEQTYGRAYMDLFRRAARDRADEALDVAGNSTRGRPRSPARAHAS